MLGFVEPGFVKFLKVICPNHYRSVENAEKIFREKEKQLARGLGLAQEKYVKTTTTQMSKFPELKKTSLKLNMQKLSFQTWRKFKREVEKYWYIDNTNHINAGVTVSCYFREMAQKLIYNISFT